MALVDWWLEKDSSFASAGLVAVRIAPYNSLDNQVARALFEHDAKDLYRDKLLGLKTGGPEGPQFFINFFETWPTTYKEALEEWRAEGRPLVDRAGSAITS